ncbi:MAG: GntR family transcriptional regulator [Eubacteriales bacterium]|nr:GntR family transcriptional regulator [Eubacteriales bacterium]
MSKYTQLTSESIREDIEEYIDTHGIIPHEALPSERELAELLQVNRVSLRRAIAQMAGENRIYTVRGHGTFLSPPKFLEQTTTHISFTDSWRNEGHRVRSEVLRFAEEEANLKVSQTLSVPLGSPVFELRRLRLIDETPVAVETSYLLASLCPGLTSFHFGGELSLYATLSQRYGIRITRQQQRLRTTRLTEEEARLMGSEPGGSAFYMVAAGYGDDGVPVEHSVAITRADRYAIVSEANLAPKIPPPEPCDRPNERQ